jgi:transposase
MKNIIAIGADVHEENILCRWTHNQGQPHEKVFANTPSGRRTMTRFFQKTAPQAGDAQVAIAYEASYLGFGLYDEWSDVGFHCSVLAPTRITRSPGQRKRKTDSRDAERILEIVRGHIFAGNSLPAIWIPDLQTRHDRELVRMRLDRAFRITAVKTQILFLLKRSKLHKPRTVGKSWSKAHVNWLSILTGPTSRAPTNARVVLASLIRQWNMLEKECGLLEKEIKALSQTPRYAHPVAELCQEGGVGLLTAMVFLTEMGDLSRFKNRRQVGAYLGLVPSSNESGKHPDRKGHITHQGSPRVRHILCQAVWARVRTSPSTAAVYNRIVARNPKHKNIAVVAVMRRLAIKMWHVGLRAQRSAGVYASATAVAAA